MKFILSIVLFVVTFLLMYINDIIESRGKITRVKKIFVAFGVSIALSITASVLYDYIKGTWLEESIETGVLRGSVPYFVETNEQYGNFCIALESKGELSEQGFQISIGYVNSEYAQVMVWEYVEPVWFNIEPMEYEFTIMSPDGTYNETYPCEISSEGNTLLTLPIY